jgi:hypothetical protein
VGGAAVVSKHADLVAQPPQDAQDAEGPQRTSVLVGARDLMVDIEDHDVATRADPVGNGEDRPMRLMRQASLAQRRVSFNRAERKSADATMRASMREIPILDQAIVDVLHSLLEGTENVHLVEGQSAGAGERLARSLGGRLTTAERSAPWHAGYDTVVVLDEQRLGEAQAAVGPEGTLVVAVVNAQYGWFLLRRLEGHGAPEAPSTDVDCVCARLESDGWEVTDATPVTVPLALMPFDPARIPKTMFAYLYARHPELETYCLLLRARRSTAQPRRFRPGARPSSAGFPTMPWKTESEWREEGTRWADQLADSMRAPPGDARVQTDPAVLAALESTERMMSALRLDLTRRDEELGRIKSSLTWRAIVRYRMMRERVLPPRTRRGRLYDRVRAAVARVAQGARARG